MLTKPKFVPDPKTFVEAWEEVPGVEQTAELVHSVSPPMERPTNEEGEYYAPVMPPDIRRLSVDEVAHLLTHMTSYQAWLDEVAALEEAYTAEAAAFVEGLTAEKALGKTGSIPDRKMKAITDPTIAAAQHRLLVQEAKAKLLRAKARGYEKMAGAVSRELSRRLSPTPG